mmetsp:Transcript_93824/g.166915  ORF Transcript_93824/g.166915 Transcript_93824/m.166915 type:complete len:100 (-) Transcript_93824:3408-3707(-)
MAALALPALYEAAVSQWGPGHQPELLLFAVARTTSAAPARDSAARVLALATPIFAALVRGAVVTVPSEARVKAALASALSEALLEPPSSEAVVTEAGLR